MPSTTRPAHGAIVTGEGVQFSLWAPLAETVELLLDSGLRMPMIPGEDGLFELFVERLKPGATYRYCLDGGEPLPDPASRFQPEGVHGPSQIIDPSAYPWKDAAWQGIPRQELVFYELHVGTFTPEGTFRSLIPRLPYLKELGITAVELMPLADFAGRWNWGYDPAAFYAPSRAYGTPDDLRALVDAAHEIGLAVFIDVIYNHFGPDGAYATAYAPFHSEKHHTPWGAGINLDDVHCRGVRDFFIDNALHWLGEYHFDGIRLDAINALQDDSTPHFLAELSEAVDTVPGPERYLIAEDFRNLRTVLLPRSEGGYEMDGVWADDFHHLIRHMLAGDTHGYYGDYVDCTAADLAVTIRNGWYYSGQPQKRSGIPRGTDASGLPYEQFVFCIQNHDQIGNRVDGDRLHHEVPLSAFRAASALLLWVPQTPLMFMGQEWAASTPFQFFTDHHDELGVLVSEGRKHEFEAIADADEVPDPQDPETFQRSHLLWEEREKWPHRGIWNLYRDLIAYRGQLSGDVEVTVHNDRALTVRRGNRWLVVALEGEQSLPLPPPRAELVLSTEQAEYARDGKPPRVEGDSLYLPVAAAAVFAIDSD
ncbi:malto-oligosyltrehalose trehalohydrolase [Candidatus Laterigemmans baculatus]|uniref:malto-oligosyltrehalose trehalohydrolase n=1 Tax=Candidatus Laterigemmans baculatus TaxID=2770505 RepID=UPI00193C58E1|nr:malto-oligosyltrehalose trehalohydrolase [Candidatus Laterigemmans baculatus]